MSKTAANSQAVPMDDYQAESDLHHLTRAHEVKKDPKRHKAAKALARKKIQALQSAASVAPTDPMSEGA